MGLFPCFFKPAIMSLEWEIVRNYNSFLVKQKRVGLNLTRDPLSVSKKHSFSDSSIGNKKAVGVNATAEGVVLSTKTKSNGVKKSVKTVKINGNTGTRRTMSSIRKNLEGQYYRPDLADAAARRAVALVKASK